jgi:hypothetical protein
MARRRGMVFGVQGRGSGRRRVICSLTRATYEPAPDRGLQTETHSPRALKEAKQSWPMPREPAIGAALSKASRNVTYLCFEAS